MTARVTRSTARRGRMRRRHGAAAVEFAVAMPLLLLLLAGTWEIGRMIDAHQLLHCACREAGRQASTGKMTPGEVQQVVLDYLERAGITTDGMSDPVIENVTVRERSDPTEAEQLDQFRITASLPLENFEWSPIHFFTANTSAITASVDWYSMRDKELVVSQDIPTRPF